MFRAEQDFLVETGTGPLADLAATNVEPPAPRLPVENELLVPSTATIDALSRLRPGEIDSLTDREIELRLRTGDTAIFGPWQQRYSKLMYGLIIRRTATDKDDIFQEATAAWFTRAANTKKPPITDMYNPFARWIVGLTTKKVADYQRKSYRDKSDPHSNVVNKIDENGEVESAESIVLGHARDKILHEAIAKLSEKNRKIILLHSQGLSHREIARQLGFATEVGARVAHHRALGQLRTILSRHNIIDLMT